VTAAAAIMTVVFGAYILSPDPIIKSSGLSLAVGILADASRSGSRWFRR
jgi:putative drug exporter of the RND superfamily